MRRSLFVTIFSLAMMPLVSLAVTISRAVLFAISFVAEPFQHRQPFAFDLGGASAPTGSISGALFHHNRHEASVSRRSAARNV